MAMSSSVPSDLIETVLFEIEVLLMQRGWNPQSWIRKGGKAVDFEQAVEIVCKEYAEYAADWDYPELSSFRELTREIKAYLALFMPPARGGDRLASLGGFNDCSKTTMKSILEVLELAREAWDPEEVGYRNRHDYTKSNANLIPLVH